METEDALTLSDAYIQKYELLSHAQRITKLQYQIILDYTNQVGKIRAGTDCSKLVMQVNLYIYHHLSEPITAEAIARSLYLSRPYLSAKFQSETGISLTEYIQNKKTEEAVNLLRFSDHTIAEISDYLGYSSPAHFTRVFKKRTGMTPGEYRNLHKDY